MRGVYLPGARRVVVEEVDDPRPAHGQVVVSMRASSICGSDLRAIYREHLGTGPEAYKDVIAGHEPSGEVVEIGPGCRQLKVGDRVVVYHIAGCGLCDDCRAGYFISCTSPRRAAYGWQRDGGHADYLLADENTCIVLPDELSFLDGACVACGFGTAYEALCRLAVSGRDSVLVTGLGPVGLAAGVLAKALGAPLVIGLDIEPARRELAIKLDAVDISLAAGSGASDEIRALTAGRGCGASVDCSGSPAGRLLALSGTRRRGRCALVGEGASLTVDVSHELIHRDLTVLGSWVTSIGRMTELTQNLSGWGLHPERIVTHRYELDEAGAAYATADAGEGGKVAIVM